MNQEAEQQIIINAISGRIISISPEELHDRRNRIILKSAQDLTLSGVIPDMITIINKLKEDGNLASAGGASYISGLADGLPVKELDPYEDIVRKQTARKKIKIFAQSILEDLKEGQNTEDILARLHKDPVDFMHGRKDDTIIVQEEVFKVLDEIEARRDKKTIGIPTPWDKVNKLTHGLHPAELTIVAGRPAMGKSALASQLSQNVSMKSGPVFIGSLEMDSSSLIERMLSGDARVVGDRIRGGALSEIEMDLLKDTALKMSEHHPILVNDSPRLSAAEVRIMIHQLHVKYNLSLAVIDYLGLFRSTSTEQRYRDVGESTKLMRSVAKELYIPVVLVAQVNRNCEQREDKRPTLADLRESGEIEQDADNVWFLFREEYYCTKCSLDKCESNHKGLAEIIIRKQRKGQTGTAMVQWDGDYTKFNNLAYGDIDAPLYRDYTKSIP